MELLKKTNTIFLYFFDLKPKISIINFEIIVIR